MAVDERIVDYGTVEADNTPLGTSTVGPDLDNHLRDIKKNIRVVAQQYLGINDGDFPGATRLEDSASPVWTLTIGGPAPGQRLPMFDFDTSAGFVAPYAGEKPASEFSQGHWGEDTAQARILILGPILGPAANEESTASAAMALTFLGTPVGSVISQVDAETPAGWLRLHGETMGGTASDGVYAGPEFQALFITIWNNTEDENAPVSGGRGANATADFAASKTITLFDGRGRVIVGTGEQPSETTGEFTERINGETGGAEKVTLTEAQNGPHLHGWLGGGGGRFLSRSGPGGAVNIDTSTADSVRQQSTTASSGEGEPHENMPPYLALHWIIKF